MSGGDQQTLAKRAAAVRALDYVRSGMKLGLGSGSTAEIFVEVLAERMKQGLSVVTTATSQRTADKARALGIQIEELDALGALDVTIDGADETDAELNLIKGGGGALLREKIVASSSREMIVIADDSKLVSTLGKYPLPVEVIPFGQVTTTRRIAAVAAGLGKASLLPKLRAKDGAPFITDSGNVIYDCAFEKIPDPRLLALALSSIPGVVEHGLFIGIAKRAILAAPDGVRVLERGSAQGARQ
jgi:ribose 5-phosphate isomerase A